MNPASRRRLTSRVAWCSQCDVHAHDSPVHSIPRRAWRLSGAMSWRITPVTSLVYTLPLCQRPVSSFGFVCCVFILIGEIRGQVVFDDALDYTRPMTAWLSGASALPTPTSSAAVGSVQVVISKDGQMGVAHGGVSGG